MEEQPRLHDDAALPEWLWAELIELCEAFAHLPQPARHAAMKRNLSERAHVFFDAHVELQLRERAEGKREGPF